MNRNFLIFLVVIALSQAGSWIQQFAFIKWSWFKNNMILSTAIFGSLVSIGFVMGAKVGYEIWGNTWSIRLVQFSIGIFVLTLCSWLFLGETIDLKNGISLSLALAIVLLQVFWK
jgi:hypothetical protein